MKNGKIKRPRKINAGRHKQTLSGTKTMNLLFIGRWHGITRDQRQSLIRSMNECGDGRLVFVITAADQKHTRRHPLNVAERRELLTKFAEELGRPFDIFEVDDTKDSDGWAEHIRTAVASQSSGRTVLRPENTLVVSANADVQKWFKAAGFRGRSPNFDGAIPSDLLGAIRKGADWRAIATESTVELFEKFNVEQRVHELFADVLLTEDGELSVGRDFGVYGAAMDASVKQKEDDIFEHIKPGVIVDKGCGTGLMLVHLSERFPGSQIVGVDLSSVLLRQAEGQHFPNHNVSVVKGNIIERRFRPGTVSTEIYSSVIHEIRSYNRYDTEKVREALRNTHTELEVGGRVIIRDGVMPPAREVALRFDEETEARFRKFAREFKSKSDCPGVKFVERVGADGYKWFFMSAHDANEFMSKKDYLKNWDIEVNEEFGTFDIPGWRTELEALGYEVLVLRSYLNEWIRENRYAGRVWVHAVRNGLPAEPVEYFDTTAVIVGVKL